MNASKKCKPEPDEKNKGKVKIVKKNTARKPHVCKCKKKCKKMRLANRNFAN